MQFFFFLDLLHSHPISQKAFVFINGSKMYFNVSEVTCILFLEPVS